MKRLRRPIRAIREPFGTAGLIVACVALIAALAGGAYAAGGGLNAKQKKEVKKIAQQFAGKPGATGAQGPAGQQGPAGANGKDGANGSNGQDGVSPEGIAFSGNQHGCPEGGVEFKGVNTTYACNGQKGTSGFTSTLPSGKTETGVWAVGVIENTVNYPGAGRAVHVPISFPIPVGAALDGTQVHYIGTNGKERVVQVKEENEEFVYTEEEIEPPACPGTAAEPEAEAGNLCVYAGKSQNVVIHPTTYFEGTLEDAPVRTPATEGLGAGITGGILNAFPGGSLMSATGTWAVTAE